MMTRTLWTLSSRALALALCLAAFDGALLRGAEAIRVGIITHADGAHLGIYFSSLASSSGVAALAVADPSGSTIDAARKAVSEKIDDFRTYRDAGEMLRHFTPQLVLVSLPAHKSPEMIRLALEAGCHVVAEKPACVRAEDFKPLVKLAEAGGLHLMLALPSRVAPLSLRAKELVDAGWLGKPYGVDFFQVKDQSRLTRPGYQKSWFASRETAGGGHLLWLGIHNVDQVHFVTGDRVAQVAGFARNVGGQPVRIEDAEAVSFLYRSGMVGTFHGGYYVEGGSTQSGATLWGSRGFVRWLYLRGPGGVTSAFEWLSTHPDAPRGLQKEEFAQVNAYQLFVQAAIDAARGESDAPITPAECLHVLEAIFAAYRSSDTGTVQTLQPARSG